MKEFWDTRFSHNEFTYGTEPNVFLKETLMDLPTGKILFPAEGEGRNAVYAAQLGWEVSAFDFSTQGKKRALALAKEQGVHVNYDTYSFLEEEYEEQEFDVVSSIYVHYDPMIKTKMHHRLDSYLKVGGRIIMEVFSKEHRKLNAINPAIGGPPDENRMYSIEEIKQDFGNYEIVELVTKEVRLKEGFGHVGKSSVLRFVGIKKENRT